MISDKYPGTPDPADGNKAPSNEVRKSGPSAAAAGWASFLARFSMAVLLLESITGLMVTFAPFNPVTQYTVIYHTVLGALTLLPVAWYCIKHLQEYRSWAWSQTVLLGYLGMIALLVCSVSGLVLTVQAIFGVRTTLLWRQIHLITTVVLLAALAPHLWFAWMRMRKLEIRAGVGKYFAGAFALTALGLAPVFVLPRLYSGSQYANVFPPDYSFLMGTNRPFAPSLARTATGGAFDARSLAGSHSCGTQGCHDEIVQEWQPSAHRYAAMDQVFQGIQSVMAKQNGPESTRYCGGCHDPISLFSGTKNLFVTNLTGLHGYQEGVSCLACHAIRETDIKGNASYTMTQPNEYLWQWSTNGISRVARDFLIRSYPGEHAKLARRTFKKPEFCAACHKQFIDAEVNRVGWVQLQNQYDNWANSHWNKKGDPRKTVECRECHMPLVDSHDPAAGDTLDYNRSAGDRKHRSHRFIAANTIIPVSQQKELPGWETHFKLTEKWLQGKMDVPEIHEKWAAGPIVTLDLEAPKSIEPGKEIPLKITMGSNKVGHDFPTGPLDIIQSWLEITVKDDLGKLVWASGKRDENNFIQKGSFLFKAEPVDQQGNLIDRHNLWEMVGVRYRRALFPGYSDQVQFQIPCSGAMMQAGTAGVQTNSNAIQIPTAPVLAPENPGVYHIEASLNYRKVDQFLLNFLFGASNKLTAPVTQLVTASARVKVAPAKRAMLAPQQPRALVSAGSQATGNSGK